MKSSDSVKGDETVTQPVQGKVAGAVTVKSSDLVKGDVTVTETVQVMVTVAGAVEGQGLVFWKEEVTVRKW